MHRRTSKGDTSRFRTVCDMLLELNDKSAIVFVSREQQATTCAAGEEASPWSTDRGSGREGAVF
jgi:hypothetical protein